ncbi:MAG TPA: hypothetical protein VFU73_14800 [Actinocrinis sp.]|nr:hypothetical protein [Actinocrinis sp.]
MFRDLVLGCGIGACMVIVAALGVVVVELRRDVGVGRARPARGAAATDAEGCRARDHGSGPEAGFEAVSEPEPPSGPSEGRVLAVLRPRGLVVVDGVVEPAEWRGPGAAPARGGAVLLTRSAGVGGWLAWPPTGPGAGAERNRRAATACGADGAHP